MTTVSIIIPAHNEEKRIGLTLSRYLAYFNEVQKQDASLTVEFVIVLNGCTDNTAAVVRQVSAGYDNVHIIDTPEAGKGLAVKIGFQSALERSASYIGFVDADMATQPMYFHDLIRSIGSHDSIIASRYMKGAQVYPARPLIKRLGSMLVYDSLVAGLFGMRYNDVQCGAKLFSRAVISAIVPHLQVRQWAFDVELLYLCKRYKFTTKEHPTVWHDQADSKLNIMRDGLRMPVSLVRLRLRHSRWSWLVKQQ